MVVRETSTVEKGFLAKMRKTGRRLVVFYGSQTGTAEEFAGRLAKEGARYGLKGIVADPEEENMEDLQQLAELDSELGPCIAVFMMATYGEGDPTDNAMEFNEKLTNDEMDLAGMKFSVFGLGNKTYEHFNKMGKFVDSRLEELGEFEAREMPPRVWTLVWALVANMVVLVPLLVTLLQGSWATWGVATLAMALAWLGMDRMVNVSKIKKEQ